MHACRCVPGMQVLSLQKLRHVSSCIQCLYWYSTLQTLSVLSLLATVQLLVKPL